MFRNSRPNSGRFAEGRARAVALRSHRADSGQPAQGRTHQPERHSERETPPPGREGRTACSMFTPKPGFWTCVPPSTAFAVRLIAVPVRLIAVPVRLIAVPVTVPVLAVFLYLPHVPVQRR